MKKYPVISLILIMLAAAAVAAPEYINYQGILKDRDGKLISGERKMTFVIHATRDMANPVWQMTENIKLKDGEFNIKLGSLQPNILGSGMRWLEVKDGEEEFSPLFTINTEEFADEEEIILEGYASTATGIFINPLNYSGIVSESPEPGLISAGEAILEKGQAKVVVDDALVDEESTIFLTPKFSTSKAQLIVDSIETGTSFTVKIHDGSKASEDTEFYYAVFMF